MNFIPSLQRSSEGYDSIWVIVDQMTKSTYFLLVKTTNPVKKLAKLYLKKIVHLHGVLVSIVLDQDAKFTSTFCKELQDGFGTRLKFSTTSHPQTNGHSERTIQTLEGMLRVCVLDFPGSWVEKVVLIEFAYNNIYHQSLEISLSKALYEKKCQSLIHWHKADERKFWGSKEVDSVSEEIEIIKKRFHMKVALMGFAYNNRYHQSMEMPLYDAL